jgi:hypothetical protein
MGFEVVDRMRSSQWGCATASGLPIYLQWPVPAAEAATSPAETAQELARNLDLQQTLPGPKIAHDQTLPAWHLNLPIGDLLIIVASVAIAVGVLFALWTIRDRLPMLGRRKLVAAADAAGIAASVENMVASQLEADELAGRGQIAEAMHVLLLRSLTEMRKTLDIGIPDSLTSREVLGHVSLPELGRQALADLIHRVELVYFGTRPADQGNYAACRQNYMALVAAMRTGLGGAVRG